MDTNDLRAVLDENEALAPDPGAVLEAVNAARRPSPSRRQGWIWLAAVIAVILVLGAVVLITRRSAAGSGPVVAPPPMSPTGVGPSQSALTSTPARPDQSGTASVAGAGTSQVPPPNPAALAAGRWSSLPAAPIKGRSDAASTWTGTEMFVWGGQNLSSGQLFADGALYDPATRAWRALPASPLSARSGASAFWTGTTVLVLGSAAGGATYDPANRVWRTVAMAPTKCPGGNVVVWTGTVAVVLGNDPSGADLVACVYDPAADLWSAPIEQQQPNGHDAPMLSAVAIGSTVYVFSAWTHIASQTSPNGITEQISGGVDSSALDIATSTWRSQTWSPDPRKPGSPLAIGTQIFMPAQMEFSGVHSYPMTFGRTGVIRAPATGTVAPVPHGPIDDLRGEYVWTGSSVLGFNSGTYISGPDGGQPGAAAVLDPATGTWTSLPHAPLYAQQEAAVWTGTELLMWGQMYSVATAGSSAPTGPQDTGLSFGPG